MRRLLVACVAMMLGGCAGMMAEKAPVSASATLRDKAGMQVGTATLTETSDGVRISINASNLPPGSHGAHIHAVGVCQTPAFESAGGHFNPGGKKHGRLNPEGPHAGDLPNMIVAAGGEGKLEVVTKAVTLGRGPTSLFGDNGTSIVIHADADDERTDPTGNSGGRIACGVIVK